MHSHRLPAHGYAVLRRRVSPDFAEALSGEQTPTDIGAGRRVRVMFTSFHVRPAYSELFEALYGTGLNACITVRTPFVAFPAITSV